MLFLNCDLLMAETKWEFARGVAREALDLARKHDLRGETAEAHYYVALTEAAINDWERAKQAAQTSVASYDALIRGRRTSEQTREYQKLNKNQADAVGALVEICYQIAKSNGTLWSPESELAFINAQQSLSNSAGIAIQQISKRTTKGDARLSLLIRRQQDLSQDYQKNTRMLEILAAKAESKDTYDLKSLHQKKLDDLDEESARIKSQISNVFYSFGELFGGEVVKSAELMESLYDDEAVIVIYQSRGQANLTEGAHVWAISNKEIVWVRSNLGRTELMHEVQALRCGLDEAAWQDYPCEQLTGKTYTPADHAIGKPLPFDHTRAYKLYQALFGQLKGFIKGKHHLMIVPSGPLTQLPFQALVTERPEENGDNKSTAWFVREHAFTVLPAVSSVRALRRVARPSAATRPMIGFGNPLLDGEQNHPRFGAYFKQRAQLAREKQRCPETMWRRLASLFSLRRGVAQVETREGLADVAFVRQQMPLPDTADELCAVAHDVGAPADDIYLGERATEREVKRLSASGELAKYRIVHFADSRRAGRTDAGQLRAGPSADAAPKPERGRRRLSHRVRDRQRLKLDADWVILSACNTAAGGAQGAEALSGLARAFIYAQARALLVSHWEVDFAATVKLITGAMRRLAANKSMGRAEAMRQSMLALIDKGTPQEAHPAYWAPFVVVGEGGAGR